MKRLLGNKKVPRQDTDKQDTSYAKAKVLSVPLGFSNLKNFEQDTGSVKTDVKLGMTFLRATEDGDLETFDAYIRSGYDVNFQDPKTGQTALHIAGGTSDKYQIRALVTSGQCDFLIRDKQNKLPSEVAFEHSEFREIWKYLQLLEKEQAEVQGVNLS